MTVWFRQHGRLVAVAALGLLGLVRADSVAAGPQASVRPDDAGAGHRILDDLTHSRYRVADYLADSVRRTEEHATHPAGDRARKPVKPLAHQVVG